MEEHFGHVEEHGFTFWFNSMVHMITIPFISITKNTNCAVTKIILLMLRVEGL